MISVRGNARRLAAAPAVSRNLPSVSTKPWGSARLLSGRGGDAPGPPFDDDGGGPTGRHVGRGLRGAVVGFFGAAIGVVGTWRAFATGCFWGAGVATGVGSAGGG